MAAFEMSKYSPYRSLSEYRSLRPQYVFGGKTAETWVSEAVISSLGRKQDPILAECGCGHGPLWDRLPSDLRILAVEPNRELWRDQPPAQVTYLEQEGFDFLRNHSGRLDLIAWMWALNYPLLAFFEHYDPNQKTVQLRDWLAAHRQCLDNFSTLLEKRCSSDWVVLFFDGESAEQAFVTSIWEEVAPFPFNDRSHTRKILEMAFEHHVQKTGARLEKTRLNGFADYGDLDLAVDRMMNFHLRGNFKDQEEVRGRVKSFLAPFQEAGNVRCPAGAYLYHLHSHC